MSVLPPVDLLPSGVGGVYVLVSRTEVLYVGQSCYLRARIMDHLRTVKSVSAVHFTFMRNQFEREDLEEHLIKTLHPVLNRKGRKCKLVPVEDHP